eukprot:1284612-Prymnesium_polylepis.1
MRSVAASGPQSESARAVVAKAATCGQQNGFCVGAGMLRVACTSRFFYDRATTQYSASRRGTSTTLQNTPTKPLKISRPVWCADSSGRLAAQPAMT